MHSLDRLIQKLQSNDLVIEEFYKEISKLDIPFYTDPQLECELLVSNGFPIEVNYNKVALKTAHTKIKDQIFCVVDIETNGGKPPSSQIIEIGAVKYLNGEIIDRYESLIYAKEIPEYIQEVTNITPKMLENAPSIRQVLEEFKIFLEDHVFVAHDVKFDYKFISSSLEQYNLGKLRNRSLCTIDLAQRVFETPKYGLQSLKEKLNIDIVEHHRALSDALSSTYVLDYCLRNINKQYIRTTEDLIKLSKTKKDKIRIKL